MASGDGVALPAQIFREFLFHNDGNVEGHGVVNFVEFGQEAQAELGDNGGGFHSAFVIGEALFGFKAGHADVQAGLGGIALGIGAAQFAGFRGGSVEQNDVNAMVMHSVGSCFDLAEGAAAHVQRSL